MSETPTDGVPQPVIHVHDLETGECPTAHLVQMLIATGVNAQADMDLRDHDRFKAAIDRAQAAEDLAGSWALLESMLLPAEQMTSAVEQLDLISHLAPLMSTEDMHRLCRQRIAREHDGHVHVDFRGYLANVAREFGVDVDATRAEREAWYVTHPVELPEMVDELREKRAEVARLTEDSIIANRLGWRIAEALGEIPAGATSHEGDALADLERLVTERDDLRAQLAAAREVSA